jgi:hypothetical protein
VAELLLVRSYAPFDDAANAGSTITPQEAAVIHATLKQAPTLPGLSQLGSTIDQLRVISCCGCGRDSVDFAPHDRGRGSKAIGDGVGTTSAGGRVGVIVWRTEHAITGLEVYDLGAGDDDLKLPIPESIHLFVPSQTQPIDEANGPFRNEFNVCIPKRSVAYLFLVASGLTSKGGGAVRWKAVCSLLA